MATMAEIARLAGVSRGTVDRVLNNRGGVGEETAERIRHAADQLRYSPNKAARSLSTGKWGFLLTFILFDPRGAAFYREVLRGAEEQAQKLQENGVTVRYQFLTGWGEGEILRQLEEAVREGSSGIAVFGTGDKAVVEKIREITASGIPVMTVGSQLPDCGQLGFVGSNGFRAGQTAAGLIHLIQRQEVRLGVILGYRSRMYHNDRLAGLKAELKEWGKPWSIEFNEWNNDDEFDCFDIVKEQMTLHPEVNTLFLSTGNVYGACRALERLNLPKLPKVICYDNTPAVQAMINKGVISASIGQEPFRQGELPLKLLFDYLAYGTVPEPRKIYTEDKIYIAERL